MTITYSLAVANAQFCGFAKLLTRWKGSIYKILWKEFFVFCVGYSALSIIYRCFLEKEQREYFEKVVIFVDNLTDFIPLSFVLGFYVSLVVGRWWAQYDTIPWPDRLCLMIASYVHGSDERSRMIRRTLARYLILLQALTFQAVSTAVKRRFPTTQHLVAAGIMTKEEQTVYDKISFVYGKWRVPAQWFSSLLMRAKKEGRIKDPIMLDGLFRELLIYRGACGTMLSYDWISVPLVYTQVVTLATYMYAAALMLGRQYLDTAKQYPNHQIDLYIPFFTIIQIFFYLGWLKVAEQIVNPYGEDDDDFELNWCLDRTVHAVYLIVDQLQTKHPKVRKDYFWDEVEPRLPQTKHSAKAFDNPQIGSAFNLDVEEAEYLPMDTFLEQDTEDNIYTSDSFRKRSETGIRSSFILRAFGSRFGQSFRKRSIQKEDTKNSIRSRFYGHPSFIISGNDKSTVTSPAVSRKSSNKSTAKRTSPSHSRNSSISFQHNSVTLRRFKSYDGQELEKTLQLNGILQESDITRIMRSSSTSSNHQEEMVSGAEERHDAEKENMGQRLDTIMPPIPEEPPRVASIITEEPSRTNEAQTGVPELDDLVKEANIVLKELNKAVTAQGHQPDCAMKGYESCCSLSSGDSSEDDISYSKKDDGKVVDTTDTAVVIEDIENAAEN